MSRKRRLYKPQFKAKVALAAIKGEQTLSELVKQYEVQAAQITQWKKQLLSGAEAAFEKGSQVTDNHEKEVQELRARIGQLAMEVDFLERGLARSPAPAESDDQREGSAAHRAPMPVAGPTSLDVLHQGRAGERRGTATHEAHRRVLPCASVLRHTAGEGRVVGITMG